MTVIIPHGFVLVIKCIRAVNMLSTLPDTEQDLSVAVPYNIPTNKPEGGSLAMRKIKKEVVIACLVKCFHD